MSLSDSFADFLTRLRNASRARLRFVDIHSSKLILQVVEILKREGFVHDFLVVPDSHGRRLRVYLRYNKQRASVLRKAVRVSKPGRRRYVGVDQINPIEGGIGRCILTTNLGVMTGKEAKKAGVGGELLCYFA